MRPRLEPEDRVCLICRSGEVENELHFLLFCNEYKHFRQVLFGHISDYDAFCSWDSNSKLRYLVNDASMVKQTAIYIVNAFDHRSTLL